MPNNVWDAVTYPFPNFNDAAVEVWEWIFIPYFIMDVITYPCWLAARTSANVSISNKIWGLNDVYSIK